MGFGRGEPIAVILMSFSSVGRFKLDDVFMS